MQVERERGPVSFHEGQRGAEPGDDPVGTVRRATESRWRGELPSHVETPGEVAFREAEAGWLAALAAVSNMPADLDRAAEHALWSAERIAADAFIRTPPTTLWGLTRKMWALEREATDVAYEDRRGGRLMDWLAVVRGDLFGLLKGS